MNKKQTKSFLSRAVSTITALAFLVNIAVPLLAFAAPGYSISITSQVIGPLSITLSGLASGNPYVGQLDDHHVAVLNWGDGSPSTVAPFTVLTSGGNGSNKFFTADWGPISHTYTTPGPKTVTVKLYHGQQGGQESTDATQSINVVIPPSVLNVVKNVVNTGGGTRVASDFSINVTGTNASPSTFNGSETGTVVSLDAGAYSVAEANSFGYGVAYSADCSGSIASGETKTCTITNTYNPTPDTTAPVVTITPATQTVEATGLSGAVASFTVSAIDDIDGDISGSVSCSDNSGDTFALGNNSVSCSATDSSGNTGNATANVIVEDTTPPVTTSNGLAVVSLVIGNSYSDAGASATDLVDGSVPVTTGGDTVDTNTPGTYTITYDAVDAAGNNATQVTRTVTVSDVDAPVVTITPATQTVEATGSSGAAANFTVTAIDATDGDLSLSATCDQISGATFPMGVTTINCQATDGSGNTGYGSATVTVEDTTGPVITLTGSATVNLTVGDTYTEDGATATDIVDGIVAVTIGGDTVDTGTVGTYTITYDAVDAAGNNATQVTRTVNVALVPDTTPPVITLLGTATVDLTVGGSYSDAGANAFDNIDGDITANIVVVNPVDTATAGTYTITYNVSDAAGNPAVQVTRTVNVNNPAPVTPPGGGGNGGGGGGGGGGGSVSVPGGGGGLLPIPQVAGASTASTEPVGEVLGEAVCSVEYLRDYLRMGKKNDPEQVILLQDFLNRNLGLNLPKTGVFGQLTKSAVEQFQVKYSGEVLKPWVPHGLPSETTPTGYVYKTTKRWINMLECPDLNLVMPELP